MSAPPLKRPVLNCRNKRRYSDELTARAGVQVFLQGHQKATNQAWIYKCPECNGWHMTSKGHGLRMMITRTNLFCAQEAIC